MHASLSLLRPEGQKHSVPAIAVKDSDTLMLFLALVWKKGML